ncbi:hypothetical protein BDK51DRAFT_51276, partial [Blyttiomyces helicus]
MAPSATPSYKRLTTGNALGWESDHAVHSWKISTSTCNLGRSCYSVEIWEAVVKCIGAGTCVPCGIALWGWPLDTWTERVPDLALRCPEAARDWPSPIPYASPRNEHALLVGAPSPWAAAHELSKQDGNLGKAVYPALEEDRKTHEFLDIELPARHGHATFNYPYLEVHTRCPSDPISTSHVVSVRSTFFRPLRSAIAPLVPARPLPVGSHFIKFNINVKYGVASCGRSPEGGMVEESAGHPPVFADTLLWLWHPAPQFFQHRRADGIFRLHLTDSKASVPSKVANSLQNARFLPQFAISHGGHVSSTKAAWQHLFHFHDGDFLKKIKPRRFRVCVTTGGVTVCILLKREVLSRSAPVPAPRFENTDSTDTTVVKDDHGGGLEAGDTGRGILKMDIFAKSIFQVTRLSLPQYRHDAGMPQA